MSDPEQTLVSETARWTAWLDEIGRDAVQTAGGKAANLGALVDRGHPVPPGFVVLVGAYQSFMEGTGAAREIAPYLARLPAEPKQGYEEIAGSIRGIIEAKDVPAEIVDAIGRVYGTLCRRAGKADLPVAVRSSAVSEDSAVASFAGQFETQLGVRGERALLDGVRRCWASLFTARAMSYRMDAEMPVDGGAMGVCVQAMVNARAAGVCLTVDPLSGDPSRLVVEGSWGLGEAVAQGLVAPDRFVVNKDTLEVEETSIGEKAICIRPSAAGTRETAVAADRRLEPCLTGEELRELAGLARSVEAQFGAAQDLEWVVDSESSCPDGVKLVQTRPATAIPEWKDPTDRVLDSLVEAMRGMARS